MSSSQIEKPKGYFVTALWLKLIPPTYKFQESLPPLKIIFYGIGLCRLLWIDGRVERLGSCCSAITWKYVFVSLYIDWVRQFIQWEPAVVSSCMMTLVAHNTGKTPKKKGFYWRRFCQNLPGQIKKSKQIFS